MRLQLAFASALVAVGAACCPIPVPRDVSVRPQLTIEVTTPEGVGLEGAEIEVRRFIANPGPETLMDRWVARSGPGGTVTLSEIVQSEPHLPLMMHGVNWYGWEACATHPDHPTGCARYDARKPVEDPLTLRVSMGVGSKLLLENRAGSTGSQTP